ncbi:SPOR domain-containing protein [Poriferisphaera sp. WC338]|uniref:SPOR domain-containing protein n=1 Tax=Poriferisphaera sp. WC338 TaxID=3425129 RepID=UPI003D813A53
MNQWKKHNNVVVACLMWVVMGMWLAGCNTLKSQHENTPLAMQSMHQAYDQGQYERAHQIATSIQTDDHNYRAVSQYIAGKSLHQLKKTRRATDHLHTALKYSRDKMLTADCHAELGIMYSSIGQQKEAAKYFLLAGKELSEPQDRANAYFFAAIAQQKLGFHSQARRTLYLAKAAGPNQELLTRIEKQLAVSGYTLQIGAYVNRNNARDVADQIRYRAAMLKLGEPSLAGIEGRGGRTFVRVQVGAFSTYEAAKHAKQLLKAPDAIIVPLVQRKQ